MKRLWLCLAICLVLAVQAAADGKFFSASDDVRQPDQKGLLWHEDGRETLLLQVKYEGAAGEFGWVVPVPSRPTLDTASSDIFYELAVITRPVHVRPWWAVRSRQYIPGSGAIDGVSVVEQSQVGPYDATVLAATRAGALAAWLKEHGYEMPPGAAEVLKSYVDRRWYYVALRIDAQRARDQLLGDLQQLDPDIASLDDAPDRLAFLVLHTADESPRRGRELLARLGDITDKAEGGATPSQAEVFGIWEPRPSGEGLLLTFDRYYSWRREFLRELVPNEEAAMYCRLLSEDTGIPEQRVTAAADALGIERGQGESSERTPFAAAVTSDLTAGAAWDQSTLARLVARVAKIGRPASPAAVEKLRNDYRVRFEILRQHARAQPNEAAVEALWGDQARPDIIGNWVRWYDAADRIDQRVLLYQTIEAAVSFAADALQTALHSGSIAPLRLEFACDELVYPLYITSLNDAAVDLQVYVLADHRMQADGFETTFAGRLDETNLKNMTETSKLVADGRDYLTELRAKLAPEDMTADLFFSQARSDKPYREEIVVGGPVEPRLIIVAVAFLLIAGMALGILAVNVRRVLAQRRS